MTVSAEEIYRPTAAIPMPHGLALANFDIVSADSVLGMVFFTERSSKSVVAIDTTTNKVVALLGQGRFVGITTDATVFDSGPNGVTVVDHKEVWAGDGDSSVKVIDIASGALVANIKTGPSRFRADELCHSPVDNVVLIANDRAVDKFISFISTKTYSVLKQIKLNGTGGAPNATNGIEQCQYDDRTGK